MSKNPDWNGSPPKDNTHARTIILQAAAQIANESGVKKISIQRVAQALTITRQTVYRHFASAEQIKTELAIQQGGEVLKRFVENAKRFQRFDDIIIASIIFLCQEIPRDPTLRRYFFTEDNQQQAIALLVSEQTMQYSLQMLDALQPEGQKHEQTALAELAEHIQRTLLSFILAPSASIDSAEKMQAYLDRWLRPALTSFV